MEKQNFWKTKAGLLTFAFLLIMIAFVMIMIGLSMTNDLLCTVGFGIIVVAMLLSPIKVFIIDRKKGEK